MARPWSEPGTRFGPSWPPPRPAARAGPRAPVRAGDNGVMPATSDSPPFSGVGAALITVFHDDGQVDFDGTAAHAARVVAAGLQAIVVAGATGEGGGLDGDAA